MSVKVSVVIPCYNYGEYLAEAVDSVLASTYKDVEIIIVDDGSDNAETVLILENFSRPKTRIIHQTNQGVSAARNNAIREAEGEYILPLDADDYIKPDYIEKAVRIFEENPDIGIVYSDFEFTGEKKSKVYCCDWDVYRLFYEGLFLNTSFFRKKDWEKAGGYKTEMAKGLEDWEFWLSLAEIGVKGYRIPELLVYYRIHSDSRNETANEHAFYLLKQAMKLHSDFYIDNLEYLIFPLLFKFMRNIPLDIRIKCTKKLLQKAFFTKRTFIHIYDSVKFFIKKLPALISGGGG